MLPDNYTYSGLKAREFPVTSTRAMELEPILNSLLVLGGPTRPPRSSKCMAKNVL